MVGRHTSFLVTKRSLRNSDSSTGKRPRRVIQSKNVDDTVGLSRREEQELNKALYASLQENRRSKILPGFGDSISSFTTGGHSNNISSSSSSGHSNNISNSGYCNNISSSSTSFGKGSFKGSRCLQETSSSTTTTSTVSSSGGGGGSRVSKSHKLVHTLKHSVLSGRVSPKRLSRHRDLTASLSVDESSQDSVRSSASSHNGSKRKVHAQRKFAQGCSLPGMTSCTPVKFTTPSVKMLSSRVPKTEDFLTFLCLRGSSILPSHLDFFNFSLEEPPSCKDGSKPAAYTDKTQRQGTSDCSSTSSGANEEVADTANVTTPTMASRSSGGLLARRSAARASAGTPETARGIVSLRQGLQRKVPTSSSSSSLARCPVSSSCLLPASQLTNNPPCQYRNKFYFTPEKSPSPSKTSGIRPGEFTPPSLFSSTSHMSSTYKFSPLVCSPLKSASIEQPFGSPASQSTSSRSSSLSATSLCGASKRKRRITVPPRAATNKVTCNSGSSIPSFRLAKCTRLDGLVCVSSLTPKSMSPALPPVASLASSINSPTSVPITPSSRSPAYNPPQTGNQASTSIRPGSTFYSPTSTNFKTATHTHHIHRNKANTPEIQPPYNQPIRTFSKFKHPRHKFPSWRNLKYSRTLSSTPRNGKFRSSSYLKYAWKKTSRIRPNSTNSLFKTDPNSNMTHSDHIHAPSVSACSSNFDHCCNLHECLSSRTNPEPLHVCPVPSSKVPCMFGCQHVHNKSTVQTGTCPSYLYQLQCQNNVLTPELTSNDNYSCADHNVINICSDDSRSSEQQEVSVSADNVSDCEVDRAFLRGVSDVDVGRVFSKDVSDVDVGRVFSKDVSDVGVHKTCHRGVSDSDVNGRCHSSDSHFDVDRTCHSRDSHVQADRTCHSRDSHVQADRTCHSRDSHVQVDRTCHSRDSHVQADRTCHRHNSHVQADRTCRSCDSNFHVGRTCHSRDTHFDAERIHHSSDYHVDAERIHRSSDYHVDADKIHHSSDSHVDASGACNKSVFGFHVNRTFHGGVSNFDENRTFHNGVSDFDDSRAIHRGVFDFDDSRTIHNSAFNVNRTYNFDVDGTFNKNAHNFNVQKGRCEDSNENMNSIDCNDVANTEWHSADEYKVENINYSDWENTDFACNKNDNVHFSATSRREHKQPAENTNNSGILSLRRKTKKKHYKYHSKHRDRHKVNEHRKREGKGKYCLVKEVPKVKIRIVRRHSVNTCEVSSNLIESQCHFQDSVVDKKPNGADFQKEFLKMLQAGSVPHLPDSESVENISCRKNVTWSVNGNGRLKDLGQKMLRDISGGIDRQHTDVVWSCEDSESCLEPCSDSVQQINHINRDVSAQSIGHNNKINRGKPDELSVEFGEHSLSEHEKNSSEYVDYKKNHSKCGNANKNHSQHGECQKNHSECGDFQKNHSECGDYQKNHSECGDFQKNHSEHADYQRNHRECESYKKNHNESEDCPKNHSDHVGNRRNHEKCVDYQRNDHQGYRRNQFKHVNCLRSHSNHISYQKNHIEFVDSQRVQSGLASRKTADHGKLLNEQDTEDETLSVTSQKECLQLSSDNLQDGRSSVTAGSRNRETENTNTKSIKESTNLADSITLRDKVISAFAKFNRKDIIVGSIEAIHGASGQPASMFQPDCNIDACDKPADNEPVDKAAVTNCQLALSEYCCVDDVCKCGTTKLSKEANVSDLNGGSVGKTDSGMKLLEDESSRQMLDGSIGQDKVMNRLTGETDCTRAGFSDASSQINRLPGEANCTRVGLNDASSEAETNGETTSDRPVQENSLKGECQHSEVEKSNALDLRTCCSVKQFPFHLKVSSEQKNGMDIECNRSTQTEALDLSESGKDSGSTDHNQATSQASGHKNAASEGHSPKHDDIICSCSTKNLQSCNRQCMVNPDGHPQTQTTQAEVDKQISTYTSSCGQQPVVTTDKEAPYSGCKVNNHECNAKSQNIRVSKCRISPLFRRKTAVHLTHGGKKQFKIKMVDVGHHAVKEYEIQQSSVNCKCYNYKIRNETDENEKSPKHSVLKQPTDTGPQSVKSHLLISDRSTVQQKQPGSSCVNICIQTDNGCRDASEQNLASSCENSELEVELGSQQSVKVQKSPLGAFTPVAASLRSPGRPVRSGSPGRVRRSNDQLNDSVGNVKSARKSLFGKSTSIVQQQAKRIVDKSVGSPSSRWKDRIRTKLIKSDDDGINNRKKPLKSERSEREKRKRKRAYDFVQEVSERRSFNKRPKREAKINRRTSTRLREMSRHAKGSNTYRRANTADRMYSVKTAEKDNGNTLAIGGSDENPVAHNVKAEKAEKTTTSSATKPRKPYKIRPLERVRTRAYSMLQASKLALKKARRENVAVKQKAASNNRHNEDSRRRSDFDTRKSPVRTRTAGEKLQITADKVVTSTAVDDQVRAGLSQPRVEISPASTCVVTSDKVQVARSSKDSKDGTKLATRRTTPKKAKVQSSPSRVPSSQAAAEENTVPTFHPTEAEFSDPITYISKIQSLAESYGMCRIIPPSSWKLDSNKISEDIRFTSQVQHVHRLYQRWGANVQHSAAINHHLLSEMSNVNTSPQIGGIEIDLPQLYQLVEEAGGPKKMNDKKHWARIADIMNIPKQAMDRTMRLYDIYCRHVFPYATLSSEERKQLEDEVKAIHDLQTMEDDAVIRGKSMPVSWFNRIARNVQSMWFKEDATPSQIESRYWHIIEDKSKHVVVHCGHINTRTQASAFPTRRESMYTRHPWNLNNVVENQQCVLKYLGPVSGVTIPTLHMNMLFSTSCWSADPHNLPYIQYLHTGAEIIWYCIPKSQHSRFRGAMTELAPSLVTHKQRWLKEDCVMVNPQLLRRKGIRIGRCIQSPRQFVVVFPGAFTATISCGYSVAESVHYATSRWLPLGMEAALILSKSGEKELFSMSALLCSLAQDENVDAPTLTEALPLLSAIVSRELELRAQLQAAGIRGEKRAVFTESPALGNLALKKRLRAVDDEKVCDVCDKICYLSMVLNEQGEQVLCLEHGVRHVHRRKHLKSTRLFLRYNQTELESLVKECRERLARLTSSQDHSPASQESKIRINLK